MEAVWTKSPSTKNQQHRFNVATCLCLLTGSGVFDWCRWTFNVEKYVQKPPPELRNFANIPPTCSIFLSSSVHEWQTTTLHSDKVALPFIFLQLLRKSLHLSWDWWSGVWCDVHKSHPTSSTKTIPDPGSVQQQLRLQQQRVWRQLPDSAILQMVPSRGGAVLWHDLCQMQLHIDLSCDLPRQSAYLHNPQCWTATLANLYTTLQARTTTTIQH